MIDEKKIFRIISCKNVIETIDIPAKSEEEAEILFATKQFKPSKIQPVLLEDHEIFVLNER